MPSLLLTNANRVINKLDDLHLITLHYQIDIIAITETWLTGNIVNSAVALPNFTIFRRDRKHGIGGGVMCYIADSIWTRVLDLAASDDDDFEIFWILLRPRLLPRPLSCIILSVVYCPPWYCAEKCKALSNYIVQCIDKLSRKYADPCFLIV